MSGASNHLPKYRKHRASGQAVVTVGDRDYYLGPHGTKASRLEYDRLIAEWLASGRSASFGGHQHELTIVELVADYMKYARSYYGTGPRSTTAGSKYAVRPLLALYGRSFATAFCVLQFKAVRESLMTGDVARTYVNQTMRKIVAVLRWGAAEGKMPPSVPQALVGSQLRPMRQRSPR